MEKTKRIFLPGSEWVYYKIYMSEESADRFLTKIFLPLLKQLYKLRIINNCFYIRYFDTFPHLRIRFQLCQKSELNILINTMYIVIQKEIDKKECWKVCIDTYEREIERYGIKTINFAEKIFGFDSICLLNLLCIVKKGDWNDKRWMLAIPLIDSFLNIFEIELNNKFQIMSQLAEQFKLEFGFNKYNSKQFNELYRTQRVEIYSLIKNTVEGRLWTQIFKLIKDRNAAICLELRKEKKWLTKNKTSMVYLEFIISHIHMMMNRLFKSQARAHEMVIYELLNRYYKEQIARLKYDKSFTI